MSITSMDIQQQSFEMARHGYDVQEVDVFLERVAAEIDELTRQNTDYANQIEDLQYQLQEARESAPAASAAQQPTGEVKTVVVEDEKSKERIREAEERTKEAERRVRETEDKLHASDRQIEDLQKKLKEAGNDAETISDAFIAAQRSANAIKEEARAEGERIYRDAEAKSRDLLQNAQLEKQAVEQDTEALKDSRDKFAKEYMSLLKTFMSDAQTTFERSRSGVSAAELKASIAAGKPLDTTDSAKLDLGLADGMASAQAAPQQAPQGDRIPSYKSAYADVPVDAAKKDETFKYGEADGFEIDDID